MESSKKSRTCLLREMQMIPFKLRRVRMIKRNIILTIDVTVIRSYYLKICSKRKEFKMIRNLAKKMKWRT